MAEMVQPVETVRSITTSFTQETYIQTDAMQNEGAQPQPIHDLGWWIDKVAIPSNIQRFSVYAIYRGLVKINREKIPMQSDLIRIGGYTYIDGILSTPNPAELERKLLYAYRNHLSYVSGESESIQALAEKILTVRATIMHDDINNWTETANTQDEKQLVVGRYGLIDFFNREQDRLIISGRG